MWRDKSSAIVTSDLLFLCSQVKMDVRKEISHGLHTLLYMEHSEQGGTKHAVNVSFSLSTLFPPQLRL